MTESSKLSIESTEALAQAQIKASLEAARSSKIEIYRVGEEED